MDVILALPQIKKLKKVGIKKLGIKRLEIKKFEIKVV